MKLLVALGFLFMMAGCVTEPAQPSRKWEVKVSKASDPKVWVYKQDGSKQCGQAPASITPSSAAQELKQLGVMVFQGRNGNDGLMHPAVCGAATGNTVELEIFEADLPKVLARGYKAIQRQN